MNELRDKVANAIAEKRHAQGVLSSVDWTVIADDYIYADAAIATVQEASWQDIATAPRPIMLEIAAASAEHEMWDRRYLALCQMYPIERCFADRDGKWGLRDFLAYTQEAMGFSDSPPPPFEGTST